MKRNLNKLLGMLILMGLITGCGCAKKEQTTTPPSQNENQTVVEQQIYEGLEFVNVGASDGIVKTVIINNTGVTYEGSKISMKIMDENGNILVELTDEIKTEMETGTTQTIETKTDIDLSKAASIEYNIVK